ncbi:MAG: excalibur calcium-binding domain-containing protein [Solirubrobacterales bacterium]
MKPPLRLVAVLLAVAALAALAFAGAPAASAGDKDCADFLSQRAAQTFFLKHGGPRYDPHRLDGDDDGIACEDNPCPCSWRQHLRPAARPASLGIDGDRRPNRDRARSA